MRTAGMMLTAVAMLALTSLVNAEDKLPIPADEYVYCTVCHGVQLMGKKQVGDQRRSTDQNSDAKSPKPKSGYDRGWPCCTNTLNHFGSPVFIQ